MVRKGLVGSKQLSEEEFLLGDNFGSSDWFSQVQTEGQLAVDVYQTEKDIVIKAPIAGVEESQIDISLSSNELIIRGERKEEKEVTDDFYHAHECYWGAFSRTVALPVDGNPDEAKATFKNGILTVRIPKKKNSQALKLRVNQ